MAMFTFSVSLFAVDIAAVVADSDEELREVKASEMGALSLVLAADGNLTFISHKNIRSC